MSCIQNSSPFSSNIYYLLNLLLLNSFSFAHLWELSDIKDLDLQDPIKTVYIINCTGMNDNPCDSTKDAYLALLMSSVDRLVATCDASATWCESKASQLLSAGSLAGFFLVTHSDLQV